MRTVHAATLLASSALSSAALAQTAVESDVPAPDPVGRFDWSGMYGGIHAGGVWTHRDDSVSDGPCGPFTNLIGVGGAELGDAEDADCAERTVQDGPNLGDIYPSFDLDDDYVAYTDFYERDDDVSWIAGGQVGFNNQVGRFVLGLEADFSRTHFSGESRYDFDYFRGSFGCDTGDDLCLTDYVGSGSVHIESELDWLATLRARLGVTFGPEGRALAYATGGIAMAGVTDSISGSFDDADGCSGCYFTGGENNSGQRVGYVLGAGGEFAITRNVSIGAEYLYVGFDDAGNRDVTFVGEGGRSFDVETDGSIDSVQTVRARLNWRFGGP